MKSLTNVVTVYMMITSILLCIGIFTSQVYLIFFHDIYIIEEKEINNCIELIFSNIIPLLVKGSFSFLLGVIISDWKYLLIGIM